MGKKHGMKFFVGHADPWPTIQIGSNDESKPKEQHPTTSNTHAKNEKIRRCIGRVTQISSIFAGQVHSSDSAILHSMDSLWLHGASMHSCCYCTRCARTFPKEHWFRKKKQGSQTLTNHKAPRARFLARL